MNIISYAQNFEDVMLWRALKHIENGFYIDVGAAWPDEGSVTKAFYDLGWHGINVEPNPEFHRRLQEQRLRDINLRKALADRSGRMIINYIDNPGLSTLDAKIAQTHTEAGYKIVPQEIEVTTLARIW